METFLTISLQFICWVMWFNLGRIIGEDISFKRIMLAIEKVSEELRKRQQRLIY